MKHIHMEMPDRETQRREVAFRRRHGSSPESVDRIDSHNAMMDDWVVTCQLCGKVRKGRLKDVEKPCCGEM